MLSFSRTGFRLAAGLAAGGASLLVLTASKCQEQTTFPGYVAEICTDKIDNDGDGKVDCEDSDCDLACAVKVTIDVLPGVVPTDTLRINGHLTNATSIAIQSVTPVGTAGAATISGETWTALLSNLTQTGPYTVTVIGSSGDRSDTATATFTRGQ